VVSKPRLRRQATHGAGKKLAIRRRRNRFGFESLLSVPKIQHQFAAEVQIFDEHCGIITKHFQGDGVVITDGLQRFDRIFPVYATDPQGHVIVVPAAVVRKMDMPDVLTQFFTKNIMIVFAEIRMSEIKMQPSPGTSSMIVFMMETRSKGALKFSKITVSP
jgi:hypothetical protein